MGPPRGFYKDDVEKLFWEWLLKRFLAKGPLALKSCALC